MRRGEERSKQTQLSRDEGRRKTMLVEVTGGIAEVGQKEMP